MRPVNPIASMLGRSPFKPLQEHMRIVKECVAEVPGLFDALIAGDSDGIVKHKDIIFAKEEQADKIQNELRMHLPKSLFMPVDRRDLLDLLEMQDTIANVSQDIAGLMVERDMTVPPGMDEALKAFVMRCVDTSNHAASIIEQMDELVEMGFRGREASKVDDMVAELGKIEDETDVMGMELAHKLFAMEDDLKPVSVMFWYQMIQWIGDIADYAEKTGDRVRLMIAR